MSKMGCFKPSGLFLIAMTIAAVFNLIAVMEARASSHKGFAYSPSTLVVTTLEDELNTDGDCSLMEAIHAANNNSDVDDCGAGDPLNDIITFDVTGTIIVSNQLSVTAGGPLLIDGADEIVISGGESVRIFEVNSGAELTLQGLTLVDGLAEADNGGGIYNAGMLTVTQSTLSGNTADAGGGIFNMASLTIIDSTLSGNGAVLSGAGIQNYDTLTVVNCTFSNNGSDMLGGGIMSVGGTASITNSTFFSNGALHGGGIFNQGSLQILNSTFFENVAWDVGGGIYGFSGSILLANTIIAASDGDDCWADFPITDGGHNIASDNTCDLELFYGSMPNTDPLLGPLQDNGGPNWTFALEANSPAVDSGDDGQCPDTDQRGWNRPIDGDRDGAPVCDIGAFERGLDLYLPLIAR